MSTPEERIAARMKVARKRAGISQEQAAKRLGVTLRTYSRWERAETHGFIGHVGEIAKALDATPDDLLGGEALGAPTAEELSLKLDAVMQELKFLRETLEDKGQARTP